MKCTKVKIPLEYNISLPELEKSKIYPERSGTQNGILENIAVSFLYIFLISAIILTNIIY